MTGSLCELSPRRVALVQRRRRLVGSLGKPREELFDPHRLLNPGQALEIVRQTVVPHLPAEEHEGHVALLEDARHLEAWAVA